MTTELTTPQHTRQRRHSYVPCGTLQLVINQQLLGEVVAFLDDMTDVVNVRLACKTINHIVGKCVLYARLRLTAVLQRLCTHHQSLNPQHDINRYFAAARQMFHVHNGTLSINDLPHEDSLLQAILMDHSPVSARPGDNLPPLVCPFPLRNVEVDDIQLWANTPPSLFRDVRLMSVSNTSSVEYDSNGPNEEWKFRLEDFPSDPEAYGGIDRLCINNFEIHSLKRILTLRTIPDVTISGGNVGIGVLAKILEHERCPSVLRIIEPRPLRPCHAASLAGVTCTALTTLALSETSSDDMHDILGACVNLKTFLVDGLYPTGECSLEYTAHKSIESMVLLCRDNPMWVTMASTRGMSRCSSRQSLNTSFDFYLGKFPSLQELTVVNALITGVYGPSYSLQSLDLRKCTLYHRGALMVPGARVSLMRCRVVEALAITCKDGLNRPVPAATANDHFMSQHAESNTAYSCNGTNSLLAMVTPPSSPPPPNSAASLPQQVAGLMPTLRCDEFGNVGKTVDFHCALAETIAT